MSATYIAIQAIAPGKLSGNLPVAEPPPGTFAFASKPAVSATRCGYRRGRVPGLTYPRVPGHEAIGESTRSERRRAVARGTAGRYRLSRGHCGICSRCRRGDFVNCERQPVSGVHRRWVCRVMIAKANALAAIPDELKPRRSRASPVRWFDDVQRVTKSMLAQ